MPIRVQLWPLAAIVLAAVAIPVLALQFKEPPHPAPIIQTPDQIKWGGRPGGTRNVTLLGDTRKAGPFITIADWAFPTAVFQASHITIPRCGLSSC